MSHAIIRGKSGRRHEVDFEESALRVEIHVSDETIENFVEADAAELSEERRRFALINTPLHLFSQATAEAAKRKNKGSRE
jgi:serine/threonine protein kinase HipA of HipAB toxin-antitoxin module